VVDCPVEMVLVRT